MDDKCLMENLLQTEKGACGLYMHGTIESSTTMIHGTFDKILEESLRRQNDIYSKMSSKGWYQMQQAEQQKIDQVKQKFSNSN